MDECGVQRQENFTIAFIFRVREEFQDTEHERTFGFCGSKVKYPGMTRVEESKPRILTVSTWKIGVFAMTEGRQIVNDFV